MIIEPGDQYSLLAFAMDYQEDEDKFKDLLNTEYSWPAKYTFKFIVPQEQEHKVESLFNNQPEIKKKASRGGKYISITIYTMMNNAEAVVSIYEAAAAIPGIISL